jgi:hypothetical protein
MPTTEVGDMVLWHDDPQGVATPSLGWIVERPGRETVSILTFSQSAGFVEKKSVRHRNDPFWRESENAGNWQQWGAWELHPNTAMLKELKAFLTNAKIDSARAQGEPVRRGPGRPPKVREEEEA